MMRQYNRYSAQGQSDHRHHLYQEIKAHRLRQTNSNRNYSALPSVFDGFANANNEHVITFGASLE